MTNEKAFKLYLATRLHFLTSYDVFESKGKFIGMESSNKRKDFPLIYSLTRIAKTERDIIELSVANFLYGNDGFLYDQTYAELNFLHWRKVKESIGHCLERDLGYIELQLLKRNVNLDGYLETHVISDILSRRIEYESLIMIDRHYPIIDKMQGFEMDKYKVRMHKANMFVTKGTNADMHTSHIDNFLINIK